MASSYVRALLLVVACLLIELGFALYFQLDSRFLTRIALVVFLLVGLLLLSPVARYVGTFLLAGSSIYTAWLFVSTKIGATAVVTSALAASALLGLIASYLLVASKSFSDEFTIRRANAPLYVSNMRKAFWGVIAIWAVSLTFLDIQNLMK